MTVALIAAVVTVYSINVVRFRQAINGREVLRLGAASPFDVPVGIWVLSNGDEVLVKQALSLLLRLGS